MFFFFLSIFKNKSFKKGALSIALVPGGSLGKPPEAGLRLRRVDHHTSGSKQPVANQHLQVKGEPGCQLEESLRRMAW